MPRPPRPPANSPRIVIQPAEPEPVVYDGPSKSQRKRDMAALQELGEELVALPRDKLARVPLSEDLMTAVRDAQRITNHEGRRRQLQFVGKLMRNVDAEPIRAVLEAWKGVSRAETAALHAAERWRERLLADDGALTELAARYSAALNPATMQQLRTAIRMARKEQAEAKPPRHYRELFKLVKELIDGDATVIPDTPEGVEHDYPDVEFEREVPREPD